MFGIKWLKEWKYPAKDGQRGFEWSAINVEVLKLEFERENFLLVKLDHIERKARNQTIWVAGETSLQTHMYKKPVNIKGSIELQCVSPFLCW